MESKNLKIGIFTTFANFRPEYSLVTVVTQQLQMLLRHGYKPVLFTLPHFKDEVPEGVEVRNVIPQLLLEPYASRDLSNFQADTEKSQRALEQHMTDIDVCLTHDIIFINSYLPYNRALKNAIETTLGHIKWLHWIHSAPSIRPSSLRGEPYDDLYILPKNSRLVYMNDTDRVRAAEMYGIVEGEVETIYNAMDLRVLNDYHPLTLELIDKNELMRPDILCVYPLSTTRMWQAGKQLDKVIRIVGNLKKNGLTVRVVVPNAHANGQNEKDNIERMYEVAEIYGLSREDLVFTSLHGKEWEQGVPHEVVRDLLSMGNIFIFPTASENCPLVLLEAMAGKNILILNHSFPALRDLAGHNALYFRFGSLIDNPQYPLGEELYYKDVATIVYHEFKKNRVIQANNTIRQKFNMDYIFKRQLEPAILGLYHEKHIK
jgi:hypothetical protein